ncbi:MAG: glycine cleavage system aminomethyltransferase GcvT [Sedimentisphaerales bacterium]|nr:glycine cleavage system aminomethyltransferase GcvT [Sedimentisphaerales bacterium]
MADVKKTVLFNRHAALAGKNQLVPFAGWMMPLWYKSISTEHHAVRNTAGLFDCSHMAVLKIAGKNAVDFLNILTTNDVTRLKPEKAQYSYILNSTGDVIDDCIVYCITENNFMLVANAANEQKVKDWIQTVRSENIQFDSAWQFEVTDLKDDSLPDARVDIALQGPAAAKCLMEIFDADVDDIRPLNFITVKKDHIDVIVSATGYTGAKLSFELFVHPLHAMLLWDTILEKGKQFGVVPCGLGARDSLRIEAGLPLYGHELAGKFDISPFQAGYAWAVKLQKENFIGKKAVNEKSVDFDKEVARLQFAGGKGVRPIRQFDGILNSDNCCIGYCLSCAGIDDKQIALALIKKEYNVPGKLAGVYYLARNQSHLTQGRKEKINIGDMVDADIDGKVIERFEKF